MIRNFISKLYSLYTPSIFMSVGGSPSGYVIERSLRFMSASSQNLTRTPSVAGDRRTWTWSACVKRGSLGSQQTLLSANTLDSDDCFISFEADNSLRLVSILSGSVVLQWKTTQLFRDTSSHYHILIALDTTQANANDRVAMYINGVKVTQYSTQTTPAQNYNSVAMNTALQHGIGRRIAASAYFDGYISEVHFIDGQALTPSSFGEINQITGQWVAKKYTGTYGTNGFYLDFKDGTSTTTLGQDKSGNTNHWTLTNFTRSAGVNDCWMLDVPAGNGSASAVQPSGNYAVMNPLNIRGANTTISRGNLTVTKTSSSGQATTFSSVGVKTGAYYWELIPTSFNDIYLGINGGITNSNPPPNRIIWGQGTGIRNNANTLLNSTGYVANDVLGFALDLVNDTLALYKNNTLVYTVTSLLSQMGVTANNDIFAYIYHDGANNVATVNVNFGQRSFAYTPPAGAKALCTANLTSTDVIESGSFTGNASADGPFIWCNGTPETLTINGNAVTWGTHADKLANGFKLRTSSSSYNSSGTNTWTATILSPESKSSFKHQNAKGN